MSAPIPPEVSARIVALAEAGRAAPEIHRRLELDGVEVSLRTVQIHVRGLGAPDGRRPGVAPRHARNAGRTARRAAMRAGGAA